MRVPRAETLRCSHRLRPRRIKSAYDLLGEVLPLFGIVAFKDYRSLRRAGVGSAHMNIKISRAARDTLEALVMAAPFTLRSSGPSASLSSTFEEMRIRWIH
jgi:hypothetical protein